MIQPNLGVYGMVKDKPAKPAKHAGGRPRTVTPDTYTPEQLIYIDLMAQAQCKDTTIAESMGIEVGVFKREFIQRTRTKRAEGKRNVLIAQYKAASGSGGPVDRIWFGKQHLEQTDKTDLQHSGDISIVIVKH